MTHASDHPNSLEPSSAGFAPSAPPATGELPDEGCSRPEELLLDPRRGEARLSFRFLPHECWWGGNVSLGHQMPISGLSQFSLSLLGNNMGNQSQPIYLSTGGRVIASEKAFSARFADGVIELSAPRSAVTCTRPGTTLREAYLHVSQHQHGFAGRIPDERLFRGPHYNSWIELGYNQNQPGLLQYAREILAHGYPPGVLMIDDSWQSSHGDWQFHPGRFPDPAGMVAELQSMGFSVLLWICPFVSPDTTVYRDLARKGLLIRDPDDHSQVLWAFTQDHPKIVRWWNGSSAMIDLTHPEGHRWFTQQLNRLRQDFRVDGFKFDAGDARFYAGRILSHDPDADANDHMEIYARLALEYPLSELRACWRLGGQPIAQRLRDKRHLWEDLALLVPHMITLSLLGHPYSCPDMIGGGEIESFTNLAEVDQELFVRYAQCSALMPMMQFSAGPWRVLDPRHAELCLAAARLHQRMAPCLVEEARRASRTGLPILRPLEFNFANRGFVGVTQQFMIGDRLLVAPVVERGATSIPVAVPPGRWRSWRGALVTGPCTLTEPVGLEDLPFYECLAD